MQVASTRENTFFFFYITHLPSPLYQVFDDILHSYAFLLISCSLSKKREQQEATLSNKLRKNSPSEHQSNLGLHEANET